MDANAPPPPPHDPPAPAAPPPTIEDGRVLCYRLFDVGDEIALDGAQRCLKETRSRHRARLDPDKGQGLIFTAPPLDIDLGKVTLDLPPPYDTREVEANARVYDYGAVSIRFEVPIVAGSDLASLLPLCDHLYASPAVDRCAARELDRLLPEIAPAIEGRKRWSGYETYTVIFVRALRGDARVADVLATPLLAKLLLGELSEKRLSEEERADVVKHASSYFEDDLVVIDWNSAFVIEPSGARDVPDLLELANSQLLELRYYDDLLDGELRRIYDDVAQAHRRTRSTFWSPYGRLMRAVLRRVMEVNEFTERVDNALKVVGDFYLARVYASALRRLRVEAFKESVTGKQKLVVQAYEMLKAEAEIRRSTILELVVIVLIALEMVIALRGRR